MCVLLLFLFVCFLFGLVDMFRKCEEELRKIDNIRMQRQQRMEQRREYATVEVMQWLKDNQQLFKQTIFEPVCISLNIRDPRYAKQAEAFFGGRDFFSFVAQNDEDRELFLREVNEWSMDWMNSNITAKLNSL